MKLKKQPDNSVISIHHHPKSTSLSDVDIDTMSRSVKIKEVRVVGSNGKTYCMSIGTGIGVSAVIDMAKTKHRALRLIKENWTKCVLKNPKGELVYAPGQGGNRSSYG